MAGNDRLRHRPAAALSRADLAEALTLRDHPGDRERAAALLTDAAAAAAGMDMPLRVEQWSARALEVGPVAEPVVLARDGAGWTMAIGGARHDLPDLVGLAYLAVVLARPGREVSAAELCGSLHAADQDLLDVEALGAYRERLRELDADIADAADGSDLGRLEALRREHDALTDELGSALGLSGRIRRFGAPPERARTAVRKAIKRALDAIAGKDAVLGGQLRDAVITGAACRYDPRPGTRPWRVRRG